jgi:hypothetical protein
VGYSNCNTTGSNATGCECHTTQCCVGGAASSTGAPGATCETVHSDGATAVGLGQTWADCTALGTHTAGEATAACLASGKGTCSSGWNCSGESEPIVCAATGGGGACKISDLCWAYGTSAGSYPVTAGNVVNCQCPSGGPPIISTWQ